MGGRVNDDPCREKPVANFARHLNGPAHWPDVNKAAHTVYGQGKEGFSKSRKGNVDQSEGVGGFA